VKQKERVSKEHLLLSKRTETEWVQLVGTIGDKGLRFKISAIIWWDWTTDTHVLPALKPMARALREHHYYIGMEGDIFHTLILFGYSERKAKARCVIPSWKRAGLINKEIIHD